MNKCMTGPANRLNIKKMFSCISQIMMVLFCCFPAITTRMICWGRKSSAPDRIIDGISRLFLLAKFNTKALVGFFHFSIFAPLFVSFLTFIKIFIAVFLISLGGFVFTTYLTLIMKSIFRRFIFSKIFEIFDLLASGTSFCYDSASHIRTFLRLWLKPLSGHDPVCGLLYYSKLGGKVNGRR